jgi:hypothetical protein
MASTVRSRRTGLWLLRLLLVLLSVLLPLVALEAAFRIVGPFIPGNYDTGAYLTRHPRYGHYHPANYSGWIKRDEFTVHVRTNAERQRGPLIPFERSPGTFRILVLGDSFVEAVQVAEHERFVDRLRAELNAAGGPTRFEVVDGGCGGWGAVQQLLYLQHEGPRYRPDLVLLAFFTGNDVHNNSLELELEGNANAALKPYFERQPGGDLVLREPNPPPPTLAERLGFFLRERSALYNVVESGVLQKLSLDDLWASVRDLDGQVELSIRESEVFAVRLDARWRAAWSLTDTLLGRIATEASEQGAGFALTIVPTRAQVLSDAWNRMMATADGRERDYDPMQPNNLLAGIAARTATPLLDLTPAFREAARRRSSAPLYFARDQHWTAAGHELAARQLVAWLRSSGLIPD